MANYTTQVSSPWAAEQAFEFIADFRNLTQWDPGVSASKIISGGEPGVGTIYSVTASGATLDYVTQIHEPPNRFVVEGASKFFYSYDAIDIETTDDGCILSYDATLKLRSFLSGFTPTLGLFFNHIGDKAAKGMAVALDGEIIS